MKARNNKSLSQKENIELMKSKALKYYRELPNKTLAANSVGRSIHALLEWETNDPNFANAMNEARAAFATENVKRIRDKKWILAHTLKEEFADRTEITGANGESVKIQVINGNNYTIPATRQTNGTPENDTSGRSTQV